MKRNLLKKFVFAAMAVVMLAACGGNEVDPRDAFVGAYAYTATGSVDFQAGGLQVTLPLNKTGNLTISKVGDGNKVVIEGYNDPINATVSGNQLILESNTWQSTSGGIEFDLTFTYGKATLSENQLTWDSDVYGTAKYSSITADGNGDLSVVAIKQ